MRARRRAGGFEYGGSGHDDFDRAARLHGKSSSDGWQVNGDLSAKAAADFCRDDLDVGDRNIEQLGRLVSNAERALGAGPDGDFAIGVPMSGRCVRFDVTLVNGRCVELSFNDDVGFFETFGDVALLEHEVLGDVGVFRCVV